VRSVRPGDAGQYRCASNDSSTAAAAAVCELVVLGTVPHCTTQVLDADLDLTGAHLPLNCTLDWTVNFDPGMPWIDPAGVQFLRTHHLISAAVQRPSSQGPLVARLRPAADDPQTKQFELRLLAGPTERPGYVFNWSDADVDVQLAARNVRIHSEPPFNFCCSAGEVVLSVGARLICAADGRPQVGYVWEQEEGGSEPWTHRRYGLSTTGLQVLRCTASNTIRGRTYNASRQINVLVVLPTAVDGPDAEPDVPAAAGSLESPAAAGAVYPVVVGLSVAVVVVAVAVACLVDRRRSKLAAADRRRRSEVDAETTAAAAAAAQSVEAAVEGPAPPQAAAGRRRTMPLPAIVETQDVDLITQDDYDEYKLYADDDEEEEEVHAASGEDAAGPDTHTAPKSLYEPLMLDPCALTQDPPRVDDDEVGASQRMDVDGDQPNSHTAPKFFHEPPSLTLDLRSCTAEGVQTAAISEPTNDNYNKYITLLGFESKATTSAIVHQCCSHAALPASSVAESCGGRTPAETAVQ